MSKTNSIYRAISLLTAAGLFASLCSCAEETDLSEVSETTTTGETVSDYVYPELDLEGKTISILNMDEYWGMHISICTDEQNGESLNDAVWERNRSIEDRFNCRLEETRYPAELNLYTIIPVAQQEIMAGDSTHDVMYLPDDRLTVFTADNGLIDLATLEGLNLDGEWWDRAYNEQAKLGDSLWGASGDVNLMSYDSSWCIFFNEDILTANGEEAPYDLVREGKWTIDALHEYCARLANLNGDASFDWQTNGSARYGMVTHAHTPDKFIFAADINYVERSGEELVFTADSERFYSFADKLASLLGEVGTTLQGNSDDFNPDRGYVYVFMNSRAAFLTAELKTAVNIRDMEATFGILPFPKYDEAQESYRTPLMSGLYVMTIPVTSSDPESTAAVMDALCYESSKNVIPIYFEETVSQKGLRNEDSIEMMELMRSSRGVDIAVVYGWNTALATALRQKFYAGDGAVSSVVAQHRTSIEAEIEKFLETMS